MLQHQMDMMQREMLEMKAKLSQFSGYSTPSTFGSFGTAMSSFADIHHPPVPMSVGTNTRSNQTTRIHKRRVTFGDEDEGTTYEYETEYETEVDTDGSDSDDEVVRTKYRKVEIPREPKKPPKSRGMWSCVTDLFRDGNGCSGLGDAPSDSD